MKKEKDNIVERKSTKESLQQIKNFLESKNLRVPKEFDEKIIEAAKRFNGGRLPPMPAIANLFKCCQYWKKYCINEEEFAKLVCAECYNMARIQCSVISTHFDTTSFIGNFCKVKEADLPECTTTVASYARAILYEGMGASEKVFTPPL